MQTQFSQIAQMCLQASVRLAISAVFAAATAMLGTAALADDRPSSRPVMSSTVPAKMTEIRFAVGFRQGEFRSGISLGGKESGFAGQLQINHGITDRFQWLIPTLAFAYRGGNSDGTEWIPWGGLLSWGLGYTSESGTMFEGVLGAGLDLRSRFAPHRSLILSIGLGSHFKWNSRDSNADREAPKTIQASVSAGYSHSIRRIVTLTISGSYAQNVLADGALPGTAANMAPRLGLGSVQELALRSLPLVKVHLSDVTSLDAYAAMEADLVKRSFSQTYLLGATFIW